MTTNVRHRSSRESVSIQPLLPRTNRQLSESRFVNLYTRSSLVLRYKGIIRHSIELCQQDGHVSFVKAQFYRYNLTFPMISRILKIGSTKDWRNDYEWFKQILLYCIGYCKHYPGDILTIKPRY